MRVYYRPQMKFAKVIFLQVSVILSTGGCAWLLWGACVVALGGGGIHGCSRGHAWLLRGGLFGRGGAWFYWGTWFFLFGWGIGGFIRGGMHGFIWGHVRFYLGGMHGFIWGACMVLFRGCMVLFEGGMCGFIQQGGHVWFFSFFGYNEIRSMSRQYTSYWNAFLHTHSI